MAEHMTQAPILVLGGTGDVADDARTAVATGVRNPGSPR
jgi:hypothetical protein